MKKVLLSLAAVTAIAATASPAAAARNDRVSVNERQADLTRRIDRSFRSGDLTRPEANQLMIELRRIEAVEHQYRRSGVSNWERQELHRRLDSLQAHLRKARRDDDRRYGYGYGRR